MAKRTKDSTQGRRNGERGAKKRDHGERFVRRNAHVVRFVATVIALLPVLYVVTETEVAKRLFVAPYVRLVASCSREILRLLLPDIGGVGTEVTAPGCVANVIDMCAGLGVAGAYIVIVLAFPASWKSRLAGVALGYPAVFLINQLRIVVLFLIAYNRLDILDTVHYYYSQAFVIFATVGVWLFWLSVIPSHGSKAAQIAPR